MKKLFFTLTILLVSTSIFAQFKVGGGITFGNKISINQDIGAGLNIRCNYSFNPKLTLSAGYTYVIPSTIVSSNYNARYTSWQINSDLHYNFLSNENFKLYALAGLVYTEEKDSTFRTNGGSNSSGSGTYSNLGIGTNYKKYFGEVKYDSSYSQVALTLGVFF